MVSLGIAPAQVLAHRITRNAIPPTGVGVLYK